MTLDPKIINKLLSDVPVVAQLRDFLAQEAFKLDSLAGMDQMTPEQRAIEVTARIRAKQVVDTMLGPLINPQDKPSKPDPRDYTVEVSDLPSQNG